MFGTPEYAFLCRINVQFINLLAQIIEYFNFGLFIQSKGKSK